MQSLAKWCYSNFALGEAVNFATFVQNFMGIGNTLPVEIRIYQEREKREMRNFPAIVAVCMAGPKYCPRNAKCK